MKEHAICVFCSSSNSVGQEFFVTARALGEAIALGGHSLVYGGTMVGLMGAVADAAISGGARAVGVIPQALKAKGIAHPGLSELIVTDDMRTRKAVMEDRATAFVGLPGGFGTLEELFEVITLKQLEYHTKPIILLNTGGFYNPLMDLIEHVYARGFARPEYQSLYHVASDVEEVFRYLETYQPPHIMVNKWA